MTIFMKIMKSRFNVRINDHTYHVKILTIYMHTLKCDEGFKLPLMPKFLVLMQH